MVFWPGLGDPFIIIIIIIPLWFFASALATVFFYWSLSDSKSSQVSWTLLSIMAVLIYAEMWMVSTHPPTFMFSSSFKNPFVTVPKAPITIGIIITFMVHSFFNSLTRSRYLFFFSFSFSFILWPAGTVKSTILLILFLLLIIIRSGLLAEIR